MTKNTIRYLRLSETLDQQVKEEAEQRGMNFSEFVRYALHLFFDQVVDSGTHDMHTTTPAPAQEEA